MADEPEDPDVDASGTGELLASSTPNSPSELPASFDKLDAGVSFQSFFSAKISPKSATPQKVGRFEVIRLLGEGGYGLVYLARDPNLGRLVAVKVCPTSKTEAAEQFRREAMVLAKFHHPRIVTVHEVGEYEGYFFYVMEYIAGIDGFKFIDQCPPWPRVLAVYQAAAVGLAAAHAERIAHGDFKPGNLLIGDDGRVCVADFGLASLFEESGPGDDPDARSYRAGTLYYMAPELLRGYRSDARSDQWAFCVALWETLFRKLPFKGRTGTEMLAAIQRTTPSVLVTRVPRTVQEVLRKGLAVEPAERHANMRALVAALREASRPPSPEPAKPPERSASIGMMALAMLVGAASVLGVLGLLELRWPSVGEISQADESTPTAGHNSTKPGPEKTKSPCAIPPSFAGSAVEVDFTVEGVCGTIRSGYLSTATSNWEDARKAREATAELTTDAWERLAADTLFIALTFLEKAEALAASGDEDQARKAAVLTVVWVEYVKRDLEKAEDALADKAPSALLNVDNDLADIMSRVALIDPSIVPGASN